MRRNDKKTNMMIANQKLQDRNRSIEERKEKVEVYIFPDLYPELSKRFN